METKYRRDPRRKVLTLFVYLSHPYPIRVEVKFGLVVDPEAELRPACSQFPQVSVEMSCCSRLQNLASASLEVLSIMFIPFFGAIATTRCTKHL
jgi:hypothetical protein